MIMMMIYLAKENAYFLSYKFFLRGHCFNSRAGTSLSMFGIPFCCIIASLISIVMCWETFLSLYELPYNGFLKLYKLVVSKRKHCILGSLLSNSVLFFLHPRCLFGCIFFYINAKLNLA